MSREKQIKSIKQNALQRRMAISLAGVGGGARLLTRHATSVFYNNEKKQQLRQAAFAKEAKTFAEKLGELKGIYVKIAQMMALYGDHLLPSELTDALHGLEHQTKSMHWSIIQAEIENSLGERQAQLNIDPRPLAAASLSQVHRAIDTTHGGQLCVKVQYPGVANTIEADFKLVTQMLGLMRWVPLGDDLAEWMQELKTMLLDEVDYRRELAMTDKIAHLLSGDNRYCVPSVIAGLSSRTVLTMEYLQGLEVTSQVIKKLSQGRRNALAIAMLEIFFKEIFEWGIMQTDPNFGNYRIQLQEKENTGLPDKLVLLDFGAVRELDNTFLKALKKTVLATYRNNRAQIIAGAIQLNCLQKDQSDGIKESFADFCILLMEPFRKDKSQIPNFALNAQQQYKWRESRLLQRVGKLGAKSIKLDGFRSPPKEFALIVRKLTGVFTFITTLSAEFDATPIIEKYTD